MSSDRIDHAAKALDCLNEAGEESGVDCRNCGLTAGGRAAQQLEGMPCR